MRFQLLLTSCCAAEYGVGDGDEVFVSSLSYHDKQVSEAVLMYTYILHAYVLRPDKMPLTLHALGEKGG